MPVACFVTSGARAGRPSIRPNAMNDRRRQLEALDRYEDLLRAAARQPDPSARTHMLPIHRLTSVSPGMCIYVLDLSEAAEAGRVTWLSVKGADLAGAPDEAIFYSLVEGRGELMMFGGIRGDARSLQRGNTSEKRQTVLNDVHFLSFCGANIR
jgi:F-box protein 42